MARNVMVTSLWLGLLCPSLVFLQISAQTPADENVTTVNPNQDGNSTLFPSTVAEIVQAISNVQRNVTETKSKVPNIKVAGSTKRGSNSTDGRPSNVSAVVLDPQLELTLFEPDHDLMAGGDAKQNTNDHVEEISFTTARSADGVEDATDEAATEVDEEQDLEGSVTEDSIEGNLKTFLEPPGVSPFSYDGAAQWFNWAVAMRDPTINPEGSLGWPTIVSRGLQGIFQYYNPLRRFMARSLDTANTINSVASDVYNYRHEVIKALLSNEIEPDMQSISNYVQNLEGNKKVAERISLLSEVQSKNSFSLDGIQEGLGLPTISNVTEALDSALDQLFEPLDTVPDEWDRFAGIFGNPFSGILRAPFYIKFVNLGLKALYVLIILAYIPFSGIENFFLAPFPPNMDSYPGMLRFWGLQAILGPDYIAEYDAELEELFGEADDVLDSAEDPLGDADDVLDGAEGLADDVGDGGVRRLDGDGSQEKRDKRKTSKKPTKKKPVYYNDLPEKIKPPPSRYGMDPKADSSYSFYNSPYKGSTSSSFAVIRDEGFVTPRPISQGSVKSNLPPAQYGEIDNSPSFGTIPVVYSASPAPTAVRSMIISNKADTTSSTSAPNLISSPDQTIAAGGLAGEAPNVQALSLSQPPSESYKAPTFSAADYHSLIAGDSIARPDFHVAEPIDPLSVAAVRNPYGYSVNTVPADRAPVVLPYITQATPMASYIMREIPSSIVQNTVSMTPTYSSKDASVLSFVLQPSVSVVPASSFSVPTVTKVNTSTTPATITITSVSSSVSTKYGR